MLRDSLRQIQKGSLLVSEYGKKFKTFCDQLVAIGHPVDGTDECHWFLCGLGSAFETFSIAHRVVHPHPRFCDLLSHAEVMKFFSSPSTTLMSLMQPLWLKIDDLQISLPLNEDADAHVVARVVAVDVDHPIANYLETKDIMPRVLILPPLHNDTLSRCKLSTSLSCQIPCNR